MKKEFVKGHPLTEKEMCEVKGGHIITLGVMFSYCPICGTAVRAEKIAEGVYEATCSNCRAPLPEMDLKTM